MIAPYVAVRNMSQYVAKAYAGQLGRQRRDLIAV
jgi:hypothetical protein